MRLLKFYYRFRNQYRIHRRWSSLWNIAKITWIQSGRKDDMVDVVTGGSIIPIIDIDDT